MNKSKKIVLDTNVLLVSISSKSRYHWIFQKLLNEKYDLFITNEILSEYEKIISEKYNSYVAQDIAKTLLLLPNVYQTIVYYKWNLIPSDISDNKFVDCAVAGNADYIVTHDKHFNVLKKIDFPKINVIDIPLFEKNLKDF